MGILLKYAEYIPRSYTYVWITLSLNDNVVNIIFSDRIIAMYSLKVFKIDYIRHLVDCIVIKFVNLMMIVY